MGLKTSHLPIACCTGNMRWRNLSVMRHTHSIPLGYLAALIFLAKLIISMN